MDQNLGRNVYQRKKCSFVQKESLLKTGQLISLRVIFFLFRFKPIHLSAKNVQG